MFKRWTGGAGGAEADGVLRRAHRLCRHAGAPGAARARATWRCACARRPARPAARARRALQRAFRRATSSTASAPPRCCTSSCPTGRARCATAPPAGRCPATTIELRGDDGRPVPDGEAGRPVHPRPERAMMYWGNRDKTRDTFQGGWTKSGDKYVRNADGSYTYGGRSDDMLKVSGIYVSPFEVEATLVQHPAVLEAAVIGVPDAEGLTKTKAFVVLKAGSAARTRGRAEGLRQGRGWRPTSTRARSSSSPSCRRPPPARSSASGCASARRPAALSPPMAHPVPFVDLTGPGGRVRIEVQRMAARPRATRRCSCSCTKAWARWRCGRTFPQRLCDAAGCRGLVYSRPGYGRSTPRAPDEALGRWTSCTARRTRCCPRCSTRWAWIATRSRPGCFGHSDGGSIALLYAARFPDRCGRGGAGAAHLRRRRVGRQHPAGAPAYLHTDLRQRLARYHDDPDSAFWGWNDIWLHPPFRPLEHRGRDRDHHLPAAGDAGPGRRIRHAGTDPRHRAAGAAGRAARAAALRPFAAPRPARARDRRGARASSTRTPSEKNPTRQTNRRPDRSASAETTTMNPQDPHCAIAALAAAAARPCC